MKCTTCEKELQGRQRKYCSRKCHNSNGNKNHQNYTNQQRRGLEKKIKAVMRFGGKCMKCGYDKNLSALHFHHIAGKDFQIDLRRFSNTSDKVIEQELSKCELVCGNCHAEIHHPEYQYWKLMVGVV